VPGGRASANEDAIEEQVEALAAMQREGLIEHTGLSD
jgi:aryl-alcohol dehydrogenase-like predicted oxidoreductase